MTATLHFLMLDYKKQSGFCCILAQPLPGPFEVRGVPLHAGSLATCWAWRTASYLVGFVPPTCF